jgi:hypothetical protein
MFDWWVVSLRARLGLDDVTATLSRRTGDLNQRQPRGGAGQSNGRGG